MEEKKRLFTKLEDGEDLVKKNGEDIKYLVLIKGEPKYDDAVEFRDWFFEIGRQEVYDHIVNLLICEGDDDYDFIVNIDQSLIYAENPHIDDSMNKLKLSNGLSLYAFIKDVTVLNKVTPRAGFNIEDYHQVEPEEVYGEDEVDNEE